MNNKGNALISVLTVIVLLSAFILGYMSITVHQYKNNTRKTDLTSLKWAARGSVNKFLNDILTYKLTMSDTLIEDKINNCFYKLKLKKKWGNLFHLEVRAQKQNIKYSLNLPLKMEFLSDYLFYVNDDFHIAPFDKNYDLYGSIFAEKSLFSRTHRYVEILFFDDKGFLSPTFKYWGRY